VDWFLPTLGFAVASALLPLLNAEVYLAALAVSQPVPIWPLAIAAGLGQILGKLLYYLVGRSSLEWRWVRRHTDTPRFQELLSRWRARVDDRPLVGAALVLVSASTGLPPFAIIAVLAGTLRLSLPIFLAVGFVGRVLRFAFVLGAADWFFG
jgi:membrane protein YqaA with SNARE-associated domain